MSRSSFQNAAQTTYINTLRLLLQSGTVVVVEGKSDQRIYQSFFRSKVLAAGCKNNIKKAMNTLTSKKQLARCRAIPDRDYDFFLHRSIETEQYVYTDAHSLETLLWKTEDGTLLDRVMCRFFDRNITDAVDALKVLYDVVFRAAYLLGLCRLVNEKNAWMINQQEDLHPAMFDEQTRELRVDIYLSEVLRKAERMDLYQQYLDEVNVLRNMNFDRWEITHGHDISRVFFFFIRQYCIAAHYSLNNRSTRDFEKFSRDAVACCRLQNTYMIQTIQNWEAETVKRIPKATGGDRNADL